MLSAHSRQVRCRPTVNALAPPVPHPENHPPVRPVPQAVEAQPPNSRPAMTERAAGRVMLASRLGELTGSQT